MFVSYFQVRFNGPWTNVINSSSWSASVSVSSSKITMHTKEMARFLSIRFDWLNLLHSSKLKPHFGTEVALNHIYHRYFIDFDDRDSFHTWLIDELQ